MSKYTEAIVQAAQGLEKAEAAQKVAAERLAAVRAHCGQRGYSITVNGVTVAVSECDRRTYQGTLIRGREMIHLGALKALGAELDAAEKRVLEWRAYLASVVIK